MSLHDEIMASRDDSDEDQADSLCVRYVLVAEWVRPDGAQYLTTHFTPGTPGWQQLGLLEYAARHVR